MIVQAEILPVDSADSGDSLVHITVVARRLNGIRQPDPESRINGMAFGYDFSVDSRIEHLGIAYKDSKIKLVAGQETGLWFKWQRDGRSKMGANDTTDAFSGPVLHVSKRIKRECGREVGHLMDPSSPAFLRSRPISFRACEITRELVIAPI